MAAVRVQRDAISIIKVIAASSGQTQLFCVGLVYK